MVLPGVRGHCGIPTFNGAATMLMMTGWCYQTIATTSGNPNSYPSKPFVWLHPISAADRASGGICATTGYWCAGRGLVTVEGRRHIREFAPQRRRR